MTFVPHAADRAPALSGNPYGDHEAREGLLVAQAYGGNNTKGALDVATAVNVHGGPHGRQDFESETFIAFDTTQLTHKANRSNPKPGDPCHPLAAGAHAPAIAVGLGSDPLYSEELAQPVTGRNDDPGVVAFSAKDYGADAGEIAPTLRAGGHDKSHANAGVMPAVVFQDSEYGVREYDTAGSMRAGRIPEHQMLIRKMSVRRLTPEECEKLQGFELGYTRIEWRGKPADQCPDGPRYKALGNSMAVPVMRWIGERIETVEGLEIAA